MNKLFRPQDHSKVHTIKLRRKGYGNEWINYNWQTRVKWYPAGWKSNHISISRRFSHLHYLACHAPAPVQKKWQAAYKTFCNKHLPYGKASMRYLNTWSAHAWL